MYIHNYTNARTHAHKHAHTSFWPLIVVNIIMTVSCEHGGSGLLLDGIILMKSTRAWTNMTLALGTAGVNTTSMCWCRSLLICLRGDVLLKINQLAPDPVGVFKSSLSMLNRVERLNY